MKNIPSYINPNNIENFKTIREERELVRFKKEIIDFMLSDSFIKGENRGFELASSEGKVLYSKELVCKCEEELKKLGWMTSMWRTMFYIYPPNEVPKILKYDTLDC